MSILESGLVTSVDEYTVGSPLDVAAAAGDRTLTVVDNAEFVDVTKLQITDPVTGAVYTYDIEDLTGDTGIVLTSDLTAAVDEDVYVAVWPECVRTIAMVQITDDGEPIPCVVTYANQAALEPGIRDERTAETVLVAKIDGRWYVVDVVSRTDTLKFEADDFYVLTAPDITAGTATIPLTHQPLDESVKLWWRTVAQEPTEYTVDADAQTITLPLASFAAAGDRVWVHYAYRASLADLADPDPVGTTFSLVGSRGDTNTPSVASEAFPAGSQAGDLFVYACITRNGYTNACPDSRATLTVDQPLAGNYTVRVWTGTVGDPTTPLSVNCTGTSGNFEFSCRLAVIRPAQPVHFDLTKISDSGNQPPGNVGTIPGLTGVSGAVGVGFSTSVTASGNHTWPSPWTDVVASGAYERVSIALQVGATVGSTPAVSSAYWRGFAIGVGLVT